MRLLIAALLGGIVLFFWGFVSHMILPIGEMGHGQAVNEDVVIAALKDGLPAEEGVYHVPGLAPDKYEDAAATAAYSAKAAANPMFRRVLDSQRAFAQRAVRWQTDIGVDQRMAWQHFFGERG